MSNPKRTWSALLVMSLGPALTVRAQSPNPIRIDRDTTASGAVYTYRKLTSLQVALANKSPFEECKLDVKRTQFAPEPSGIPTVFSTIAGLADVLRLFPPPPTAAPPPPLTTTPSDQIRKALLAAEAQVHAQKGRIDTIKKDYEKVSGVLKDFFGTDDRKDHTSFHKHLADGSKNVDDLLKRYPSESEAWPGAAGADTAFIAAQEAYKAFVVQGGDAGTFAPEFARVGSMIELLKVAITKLNDTRSSMEATLKYLQKLAKPEWETAPETLRTENPPGRTELALTYSCKDTQTAKPTIKDINFTVIFQDPPRFSFAPGLLLSVHESRSFSVQPHFDTAVKYRIVRQSLRPQIVPMGFFHYGMKAWEKGSRSYSFNCTLGLGVNLNNGPKEAEAVAGFSLGIGNFYVGPMLHMRRYPALGGNFSENQELASSLSSLPVYRSWRPGFGIAISYRAPFK